MIGPKTRICTILIIMFPSALTYLILEGLNSVLVQCCVLLATVIMSYITIVVVQDYFWLKSHPDTRGHRKDLYLLKPLFYSKGKKKDVR